jgi:enamine deaminase RidA (YjgF/YER057c/UK114 family)
LRKEKNTIKLRGIKKSEKKLKINKKKINMNFDEKIKELKIKLPEARDPVGSYVASKVVGKMLFISGQISISDNGELIKGKVGKELKTEDGYEAAKRCGLNIISQVKKACNDDLSKVKSCVKLTGFVNSTEDFVEQPKVINGASDLIVSVFGEAGMHTRAAVSANSLPLGVSVEVDAIFELN